MERIDEIGFGGLKLIQDTEMFCYGVDAVLLARFASRISHKKAADLGTNNGVIPILMSYMGGAEHITGAEMQERACRLAERNIEINGLKDRISICHTDILDITAHFSPGSFDCVVTNRLEPKYLQFISPKPGTKPNLMLIECRKNGGRELKLLDPLHVYGDEGGYSDEIRRIYGRKL